MKERSLGGLAVLATVLLSACGPRIDRGECSTDEPCPRGQSCDFEVAMCSDVIVPEGVTAGGTESPAPATFSTKPIPFYRGQVCTVHEVQAGSSFPVQVTPCFHPCLDLGPFKFKHSWNCVGSSCDAWGALWVQSSGASCPEDAFGDFPKAQCQFAEPVEFSIQPVFSDGTAVEGSMRVEIPFLSNEDAALIAAMPNPDTGFIESKINQYVEDDARLVGGKEVSLLASNPVPPETCGPMGENCDCFDVGF